MFGFLVWEKLYEIKRLFGELQSIRKWFGKLFCSKRMCILVFWKTQEKDEQSRVSLILGRGVIQEVRVDEGNFKEGGSIG